MWNVAQLVELTEETEAGSVPWSRALHGDPPVDREGETLKLQRAEDGRHTLTILLGAGRVDYPEMSTALAALWDAADDSAD